MDERVKMEYYKIYAGLVFFITLILSGSILIKFVLLKWDAVYCVTELVLLVFISLYTFVSCAVKGLKNGYAGRRTLKNLVITIISTLVGYLLISYAHDGSLGKDAVEFVFTFIPTYIIIWFAADKLLAYRHKKQEDKYSDN